MPPLWAATGTKPPECDVASPSSRKHFERARVDQGATGCRSPIIGGKMGDDHRGHRQTASTRDGSNTGPRFPEGFTTTECRTEAITARF
jgi:hypothetical protein